MQEIKENSTFQLTLTSLEAGESGSIVKINTFDRVKLRKLTAFGILPGASINVVQKYSAVVIEVGFTQIALDESIASIIIVKKD